MPFVFLALGYLIHKFISKKSPVSYLKVFMLLSVTFLFDGFLAFKITEGIESVNQTLLSEKFTVLKALKEVNFWVVIFAGFVTYIVWGLVFDFVMETKQNFDQIGILMKRDKEKINDLEERICEAGRMNDRYQKQIDKYNLEIAENDHLLKYPEFPLILLERVHHEFMTGWNDYMIENCSEVSDLKNVDSEATHCLKNFIYNKTKTYTK
jgi:hypothetical protein